MYTETFEEFKTHMDCPFVTTNRGYLFSNGAMSNGHQHIEPPSDPRALIELQREFLSAQLKVEERKFQESQPRPETEAAFSARQDCPRVIDRGHMIFENGAVWTPHGGVESPDDPVAKLNMQLQYLGAKLEQTERQFDQCQQYIRNQSDLHARGVGPPAEPRALDELERFAEQVHALREQIAEKQAELDALLPPSPEDQYIARRNAERQRAHEALQRAQSIEI